MEKQDSARPRRRLGFKEIVPGRDNGASDEKTGEPGVPKFDLDQQVMAKPRKVVGATRKRPGQQKEPAPGPVVSQPVEQRAAVAARVWCPAMTEAQRQVIAQIVARDIDRLCRGERVFES